MHIIYQSLDLFFMVFHSSLVVFNLFGWIWKKTRLANLITLGLTGASWTLLGIFYGPGYCPLTDWHFRILGHLGKTNLPNSYMRYLVQRLFHADFPATLVDRSTLIAFIVALGLSLYVNFRKKVS
ncbi:MAG: DUF2784 domain-containing protein [Bacteroidales bacterium]|nr:DUF2784 domain-containing protein [Bacteroidales bacterium]